MITARIDVTKIDKARLFKGAKGTYLDICLIDTPDSKYGDSHMVVQAVSKEERQSGVKGAILGNAKTWGDQPQRQSPRSNAQQPVATANEEDVPF